MESSLPQAFVDATAKNFPNDFFNVDEVTRQTYGHDWTKVFASRASAVVFPRNTDEVSRFLTLCHQHHVAVVPSGGRTGLAGGAVATRGEVVLSLEKMRRMDEVDTLGATVRVQAGAITEAVHRHCAPHGLTWPVDFASKGSSQVGGNIATNAGGVKVIRYGLTRQWVLGLQVVLADGTVLELNGSLEKNNTGIDLRQMFIGSEGVLGVITEATLKLAPVPQDPVVCLFAVSDLQHVLKLFGSARTLRLPLCAYEFFTEACLQRLLKHRNLRRPFKESFECYVLVEIDAHDTAQVDAWVESVFADGLAEDGVVSQSAAQSMQLWSLREGISESLSATGMPHKNDVALPINRIEAFCSELYSVFAKRYASWEICLFGHIGDGNLHINIMKPDDLSRDEFLRQTHEADDDMFTLVRKYQGSISAEHGIGLLKKDHLHYSRSAAEIALFRSLKHVMDPRNILNPGKIF